MPSVFKGFTSGTTTLFSSRTSSRTDRSQSERELKRLSRNDSKMPSFFYKSSRSAGSKDSIDSFFNSSKNICELNPELDDEVGPLASAKDEREVSRESRESDEEPRPKLKSVNMKSFRDAFRRSKEAHKEFEEELQVKQRMITAKWRTNDDDVRSKHKSLPRTPSKLKLLFVKTEKPANVQMTDAMIRLDTLIQSDKGKHKLIQSLLSLRGDAAVKIRFCSAVDKFDAVQDEKERAFRAQTLIHTFLDHGCMFYIPTLSEARIKSIVIDGNLNQFMEAKREVLEELSMNKEVMEIVDRVEALDDLSD